MTSFDPIKALSGLIAIPSLSKEEHGVLEYMKNILTEHKVKFTVEKNNVFALNENFTEGKYTILLNSHLDTVKANTSYTLDPHDPVQKDKKLYGLGSNDAGGALITLLGAFLHYHKQSDLPFNLIFAASAEEEISGKDGMEYLFPKLPPVDFAIVGEPTLMDISIAERGLMVLDVTAHGKSGHAARQEGVNAIYKALEDINWFQTYEFPLFSEELGPVSMNVTGIEAGTQHNVVPDICKFMVDVRINDKYKNTEILSIIKKHVAAEVKERSTRLNSSGVNKNHPIRQVAKQLNIRTYGSPTSSDQALIPCESIKIGPGDSARSHSADEFIYLDELEQAIPKYIQILDALGAKL
ncbi:MAG: acetylornithine deacetylase [Saprospiraceae bacterium]|jgi:acetylornithine deacetylase